MTESKPQSQPQPSRLTLVKQPPEAATECTRQGSLVLVGVNQWLYVLFGACPASIVLRRTCRLRSAIYPNPTDNREPASTRPAREEVTV